MPDLKADAVALPALGALAGGGWIELLGRIGVAFGIVVLAFMAARVARLALDRVETRSRLSRPALYIIRKLTSYGLVAAGFFVALSTAGINLTSLAVFAGAVGVGVGLGLQGVVREFVSGLVVIFDNNVHVGDFVELENGVRGEIVEVGPRASRIRTNDALDVILPNSKLIENQVTNWTLRGETRRIHVPFTCAYGVDKARVREAVLEAARAVPFTDESETRKTQVWLVGFGDNALEFELVVWPTPEAARRPAAMHAAYTWAIDDALCKTGIEIPFPQMDVRLRSLFGQEGDQALEALNLKRPAPTPTPASPVASENDALEDAQLSREDVDPEGARPVDETAEQRA
jgi:small-conductance mechanosensitive channel